MQATKRKRNAIVFCAIAVVWVAFDHATKRYFDSAYLPGDVITDPIAGLFRFRLVHNTGAAWGLFGDSTFALGVMSLIVCAVLVFYLFVFSPNANIGMACGIGFVVAGGIGNAVDRFALGYVVDFIEFTFIDFPVFNIADIGVTCGFVVFIIGMLLFWKTESKELSAALHADDDAAGSPTADSRGMSSGKAEDGNGER